MELTTQKALEKNLCPHFNESSPLWLRGVNPICKGKSLKPLLEYSHNYVIKAYSCKKKWFHTSQVRCSNSLHVYDIPCDDVG